MTRLTDELISPYRKAQGQALLFSHVMIVLMMTVLGGAFALVGARLITGWKGIYLVVLAVILSIEAIFTRNQTKEMEMRERFIFHASEWVAFAVIAKLMLYLVHGPAQLLQDIPRWQEDFFRNFFTAEYLFVLIGMTVVWMLSRAYTSDLERLYDRENDAEWDELGKLQNALYEIRRRISARLFIIGTLVVILAVFSRAEMDRVLLPVPTGAAFLAPILIIVAYFFMALVLLSHTQFSLLRTRWLWQRVAISPKLASNWLRYGLIAFGLLAVVVMLLPTGYSMGLLDTLRVLLDFGMQAFSVIMFLFTLPITLCLSIISLFSSEEKQPAAEAPDIPPVIIQAPRPDAGPIPWLEFLKNLLFWAIFLLVIFFALRYYFGQNAALWNAIKRFPLFIVLRSAVKALWGWLRGANRHLTNLVQETISRIRAPRVGGAPQAVRRMFNLARMSPRQKIIYFYLSMVQLGGERGIDRRPSQTPYNYEQQLRSAVPEIDAELHDLTDTFLEARYSEHHLETETSEKAASLWERIKTILRNWNSDTRPE